MVQEYIHKDALEQGELDWEQDCGEELGLSRAKFQVSLKDEVCV